MANIVKTSVKDEARIFLTDYASYNNGSQFEFGHWVDLADFDSADELNEYIQDHFNEADKKSPLPCGTPREEVMITDFEGLPESLYSESNMNFEQLFNLFDYLDENGIKSLENEDDNLLGIWNEYCSENNPDDEIFYFDDETLQMLCGDDVMRAFQLGVNAEINWHDDYLYLDGYANIHSTSNPSTRIDETILIDWILENKI